ncbi:MAG: 30S ribosomal protein S20 [Treponema sp.]|nr:30S ribosomal protein S20 [Treponema sp.]
MARNQSSAEKRFRQSEVRRIHNKAIKSKCRTLVKKFVQSVHEKDAALAMEKYKLLQKELDSAKSKGVLKANTVARKKSRMMKLYNNAFSQSAS